jgi:hypothetical protein
MLPEDRLDEAKKQLRLAREADLVTTAQAERLTDLKEKVNWERERLADAREETDDAEVDP